MAAQPESPPAPAFKRIVLKLSGEALSGDQEFGIDPHWLLHGPGDRPRQYGAGLDWARFGRLLVAVDREARAAGLAPRPEQICELTRAVFEGAPEDEKDAIERLALTFKTMKNRSR